jgi:hypothetical protein
VVKSILDFRQQYELGKKSEFGALFLQRETGEISCVTVSLTLVHICRKSYCLPHPDNFSDEESVVFWLSAD